MSLMVAEVVQDRIRLLDFLQQPVPMARDIFRFHRICLLYTSASATKVGNLIGERAKAANVTEVVFDRGGFKFCGKVNALADAARETGLKF